MTTKTPEQIADEELSRLGYSVHDPSRAMAEVAIIAAINADRAQRDVYELIAEALEERAEGWGDSEGRGGAQRKAAAALRGEGGYTDVIWDMWIGPMLDQLERVYGE